MRSCLTADDDRSLNTNPLLSPDMRAVRIADRSPINAAKLTPSRASLWGLGANRDRRRHSSPSVRTHTKLDATLVGPVPL